MFPTVITPNKTMNTNKQAPQGSSDLAGDRLLTLL
jgi:hypothetical protein